MPIAPSVRDRCKLVENKSQVIVPYHSLVDHPHCTMSDDGLLLHNFGVRLYDYQLQAYRVQGEKITLNWKFYMSIVTMHLFSGIDNYDEYVKNYHDALENSESTNRFGETFREEMLLVQVHDFVSIPDFMDRRKKIWMQLTSSGKFFGVKIFRSLDSGYQDITHLFVNEFARAWKQNQSDHKTEVADARNEEQLERIREKYELDPRTFKSVSHLTKIRNKYAFDPKTFKSISRGIAVNYRRNIMQRFEKDYPAMDDWMVKEPYNMKYPNLPLVGWPDNWSTDMGDKRNNNAETKRLMSTFCPIPMSNKDEDGHHKDRVIARAMDKRTEDSEKPNPYEFLHVFCLSKETKFLRPAEQKFFSEEDVNFRSTWHDERFFEPFVVADALAAEAKKRRLERYNEEKDNKTSKIDKKRLKKERLENAKKWEKKKETRNGFNIINKFMRSCNKRFKRIDKKNMQLHRIITETRTEADKLTTWDSATSLAQFIHEKLIIPLRKNIVNQIKHIRDYNFISEITGRYTDQLRVMANDVYRAQGNLEKILKDSIPGLDPVQFPPLPAPAEDKDKNGLDPVQFPPLPAPAEDKDKNSLDPVQFPPLPAPAEDKDKTAVDDQGASSKQSEVPLPVEDKEETAVDDEHPVFKQSDFPLPSGKKDENDVDGTKKYVPEYDPRFQRNKMTKPNSIPDAVAEENFKRMFFSTQFFRGITKPHVSLKTKACSEVPVSTTPILMRGVFI
jgi:hypothetical protein